MQLLVHVGHGKTGSSYLQAWLASNAAQLPDSHCMAYPLRSPFSGRSERAGRRSQFSQGNGFLLQELLASADPADGLRQLAAGLPASGRLLISGERLCRDLPARLPALEAAATAAGFRSLRLLLFVRDPLEHAQSLHAEMVKAHGYSGSIEAWMGDYRFPVHLLSFLEAAAAGQAQLTVHNYSRAPGAVLSQLQAWLELPPEAEPPWQQPRHSRINRSLSAGELELMRRLNHQLNGRLGPGGKGLAGQLGRALVRLRPGRAGAAPPRASADAQSGLLNRLGPELARINALLPPAAVLSWPEERH